MHPQVRRRSQVQSRQVDSNTDSALNLGRKHRPDYWLVILCAMLLAIGVVVVYAIGPALTLTTGEKSSYYTVRQLIAIALGVVAFIVVASIPLEHWRRFYKPLLVIAGLATALAIVMPVNPSYPAHRWVRLGSLSFQSVELVKFAVMIWLAGFLATRIKQGVITSSKKTLQPLVIALLILGAVVAGIQSDLGSAGVLVAMMGAMAFVAGFPIKRILMIGAIVIIGVFLAISSTPYRRARLNDYLHPSCQGNGYQACQALIAVGSGGLAGLGLGHSVQAYGYEPESDNDSIFAIYGETFGFVGCVIFLAILVALFARLKSIAERMPDDFSRLIIIGILGWISVQSIINIGAMVGLLPLKGITLPFVSYGGTSVIFMTSAMGLAFQISRYTTATVPRISTEGSTGYDDRRDGRRLRGAYHPDPGSRL